MKDEKEGRKRRKIRLTEGNAECRHLNNLPVKGLCGRCLSVWGPEPHIPPLTQCIRVYSVLIHTGKRERGSWTTEKERGATGESTDHTAGLKIPAWLNVRKKLAISGLYSPPANSLYRSIFFRWRHFALTSMSLIFLRANDVRTKCRFRSSVSAISARAYKYTTTSLVMVDRVKGEERAVPRPHQAGKNLPSLCAVHQWPLYQSICILSSVVLSLQPGTLRCWALRVYSTYIGRDPSFIYCRLRSQSGDRKKNGMGQFKYILYIQCWDTC